MDVLQAIGGTSLVRLGKVVPRDCAEVLVELEWENPTGSVKDRMAVAVIARPEADGRLEADSGHDRDGPRPERAPGTYWPDQLNNHDSLAAYHPLGEEIWSQTEGRVAAFVHCVATAATIRGVATVLSGGEPGPHKIEGVGIGYIPPLWDRSLVDTIVPIPTEEAKAMARRLACEEAIFAGTSAGANLLAAIQLGRRLGPGAVVVAPVADSGLKYLATDMYRRE